MRGRVRRLLAAAAALAAVPAAAQDISRWGPVAEDLGTGSAICTQDVPVVCAVVLCRGGALSLGLMGVVYDEPEPVFEVGIEVDGQTFRREMTGDEIGGDVLYIGTPLALDDALWAGLRAGQAVRFHDAEEAEAREFSLRGSAAELDRVASACR
jgi:hypothetical protein